MEYAFFPRLIPPSRALSATWRSLLLGGILAAALAGCATNSASPEVQSRAVHTPTEPALAAPLPGSYAALGASETYGVGAAPHTRGYAYQVAHGLGAAHFVDEGIPGTTLSASYDTELTNALAIRPSLATVFFGYNDLAQRVPRAAFLSNLHDLAVTLRRAKVRVLIIGLPDLSLLPSVRKRALAGLLQAQIAAWNRGMRQVARQTGSTFLDLQAFSTVLAAHPEYISADGLHPSTAGHTALARVVLGLIRKDRLWR